MSVKPAVDFSLVIANRNYSSWSCRAWMYLKKSKIFTNYNCSINRISMFDKENRYKDEILKYAPKAIAKVPILLDYRENEEKPITIWDSYAIIQYLLSTINNDKNELITWLPSDINNNNNNNNKINNKLLALSQSITSEMHSGFLGLREECPFNVKLAANGKYGNYTSNDIKLSDQCKNEILRVSDIWNQCFTSSQSDKWLFGGNLCIADIFFIPMAIRLKQYENIINNDILFGDQRREIVNFYINNVLTDNDVQEWMEQALKETDIIEMFDYHKKSM